MSAISLPKPLPSIGTYRLTSPCILAPMAGVTDRPFRQLCRQLGAGLTVSEMVTSDRSLWHTAKSKRRLDHRGEPAPRIVQIAGGDPKMLADAARDNVAQGAQIIDINMGCPAKKVCNKAAGSALLRDERLVGKILEAVVAAANVPVTLKIRTGWCDASRNGIRIARLAESLGVQALAVHGRTRAQRYTGDAEYDTIAAIRQAVSIPLFANGDIDSPEKAYRVLQHTQADAVMIGRGAQGNPWLFRDIVHYLATGERLPPPSLEERLSVMQSHLTALYQHYGEGMGVRVARKHVGWYLHTLAEDHLMRAHFNTLDAPEQQQAFIRLVLTSGDVNAWNAS